MIIMATPALRLFAVLLPAATLLTAPALGQSNSTRLTVWGASGGSLVEAVRDLRAEKDLQIQTLKAEAVKRDADAARRDAESIIKQREVDDLKARLAAIEAALSKLTNTK